MEEAEPLSFEHGRAIPTIDPCTAQQQDAIADAPCAMLSDCARASAPRCRKALLRGERPVLSHFDSIGIAFKRSNIARSYTSPGRSVGAIPAASRDKEESA